MSEKIYWENVKKKISIRYYSLRTRCKRLNIEPPKKELIFQIAKENYENGFKCSYCDTVLSINPLHPYKSTVISIDHKIPLANNGTNKKENIIICCYRCNIVKGTMKYKIFLKLLKILKKENALDEVLDGMFQSRFANKLERVKNENKNR